MHIAFFNRAFPPEVSATGQLLTELAEGLSRDHGCRVSVVTGWPLGPTCETWSPPKGWHLVYQERLGPIAVFRARGTTWPKRIFFGRVVNYLTYFGSACLAGLRLSRPDVVIALTDPPIIGLAALLTARRSRAKLVISYRDIFPEVARLLDGSRNLLVEQILRLVNRILIRQADRVVALGETMRMRLISEKGAPPEKVTVIPDWADCSAIVPAPKQNSFSAAHGLVDRFVVMHAGNIGAAQNLEVLVEAADHLKGLPDLLFVFIGDGVKKASLEARADRLGLKNIQFLPYQPKEELSCTFASADCFIVSLKPGLAGYIVPSKVYGILAAGRPYVAAVDEECEVARIAREYDCGLLCRSDDPKGLAEKIRLFYENRSLAHRMGVNARQAAPLFDRAKGVKAYFDLCRELTE